MTLEAHGSEKANKRKGRTISIIIHLLLLLIIFFYTFPVKKERELYPPPVTVEFDFRESSLSKYARAEEGKMRQKNKSTAVVKKQETPKVETPKVEVKVKQPEVKVERQVPTVKTKPVDPIVTDVTVEDSPIEVIDEPIEIEEPDQDILTEDDLAELEEEAEIPVEDAGGVESPEESASDSGSSSPSSLEGTEGGTGKGSKGDGAGASSGDDGDHGEGDGGAGTGVYDGSGNGVFGRKVIKRNWRGLFDGVNQSSGKIVLKVCIDRAGDVTYTEIMEMETTEENPSKLKKALKAMQGYKYEADPTAPSEQCGKYTFNLDINALR